VGARSHFIIERLPGHKGASKMQEKEKEVTNEHAQIHISQPLSLSLLKRTIMQP
jgi:hypothetical protein